MLCIDQGIVHNAQTHGVNVVSAAPSPRTQDKPTLLSTQDIAWKVFEQLPLWYFINTVMATRLGTTNAKQWLKIYRRASAETVRDVYSPVWLDVAWTVNVFRYAFHESTDFALCTLRGLGWRFEALPPLYEPYRPLLHEWRSDWSMTPVGHPYPCADTNAYVDVGQRLLAKANVFAVLQHETPERNSYLEAHAFDTTHDVSLSAYVLSGSVACELHFRHRLRRHAALLVPQVDGWLYGCAGVGRIALFHIYPCLQPRNMEALMETVTPVWRQGGLWVEVVRIVDHDDETHLVVQRWTGHTQPDVALPTEHVKRFTYWASSICYAGTRGTWSRKLMAEELFATRESMKSIWHGHVVRVIKSLSNERIVYNVL